MHDWWDWLPMTTFPLLKAYGFAPYFFESAGPSGIRRLLEAVEHRPVLS